MKAHLKKSLELLDKYLNETPKHIIDEELSFFDKLDYEGISFNKYIELFNIDTFDQFDVEFVKPESLDDFEIDSEWISVFSSYENEVIYLHKKYIDIKHKSYTHVPYFTNQYKLDNAA
jgi:hypothetical protein